MGLKTLATYTVITGSLISFPITQRQDASRIIIHGTSIKDIDKLFHSLKERRGLGIFYTHKIVENGSKTENVDANVNEWNNFLANVDRGVDEGWLNLVSYKSLKNSLNDLGIEYKDTSIQNRIMNILKIKE